jgi:lipopolysaccharide transport protein LptA
VQADQATATGLDFKDSQWSFVGAVRIRVPNGLLDSDSATVNFADNQIAEAKITGAPAQFEQRRKDSAKVTRGRAGLIEYNVEGGTVKLTDEAWLTDGASEITGQTLVYNIRDERVIANPGETDRQGVSITIRPGAKPIIKNKSKAEPGAGGAPNPGGSASGSAP